MVVESLAVQILWADLGDGHNCWALVSESVAPCASTG
jgi:hypothetical protein